MIKPTNSPNITHIFKAPEKWQQAKFGECEDLFVVKSDHLLISYWKTNLIDRIKILFGRKIRVCILEAVHPPISLDTNKL